MVPMKLHIVVLMITRRVKRMVFVTLQSRVVKIGVMVFGSNKEAVQEFHYGDSAPIIPTDAVLLQHVKEISGISNANLN